jgi:hypothetical protein
MDIGKIKSDMEKMKDFLGEGERKILGLDSRPTHVMEKMANESNLTETMSPVGSVGSINLAPLQRMQDRKDAKPYQGKESDAELIFNFESIMDAQRLYDFFVNTALLEPGEIRLEAISGQFSVHFAPHVCVVKPDLIQAAMVAYYERLGEGDEETYEDLADAIMGVLGEGVELGEAKKTYVIRVAKYFRGAGSKDARVVEAKDEEEAIKKAAKILKMKPSYLEVEKVFEDVELDEAKEFIVKHDMRKYRPSTWGASYKEPFGPHNKGRIVKAESERNAIEIFAKKFKLNPFYLEAMPATSSNKKDAMKLDEGKKIEVKNAPEGWKSRNPFHDKKTGKFLKIGGKNSKVVISFGASKKVPNVKVEDTVLWNENHMDGIELAKVLKKYVDGDEISEDDANSMLGAIKNIEKRVAGE